MHPKAYSQYLKRLITHALKEDVGRGDITTRLLIPRRQMSKAALVSREDSIVYGIAIAQQIFKALDRNLRFKTYFKDGQKVTANSVLALLYGKTRALLTAERVALNFIGRLSGIATTTSRYVNAIRPYGVKILDTRKTTPTLRYLERLAVQAGGGRNHRFNLNDMILIKDNHLVARQSKTPLQKIIARAKKKANRPITVEVSNLSDYRHALSQKPDVILLDNMPLPQIKAAVRLKKTLKIKGKPLLEASGGITLKNIRTIAKTGVDQISVGALTHSPQSIDVALEFLS